MYKIDSPGNDNGQFVDEDEINHIPGTEVPADYMNMLQAELVNVIEAAGITLDKTQNNQLLTAIRRMVDGADLIVRYTTTGNVNANGLAVQAGGDWAAPLTAGDLILRKNQVIPEDNGWFIAAPGGWPRVPYLDSSAEIQPGKLTKVTEGTILHDSLWMLTTDAPIVLGSSQLIFQRKDQIEIQKASNAEVLTGTDNTKYVTAAGLLAGLLGAGGSSANDYITIPYRDKTTGVRKNLIIQFGTTAASSASADVTTTLPFAFPNNFHNVVMTNLTSGVAVLGTAFGGSLGSFPYGAFSGTGSRVGGAIAKYIAIGD